MSSLYKSSGLLASITDRLWSQWNQRPTFVLERQKYSYQLILLTVLVGVLSIRLLRLTRVLSGMKYSYS